MADIRLGEMEYRFAKLIWDNEKISSGELVKLCERELNWKKSTTYTMLRRLCEKGLFVNEHGCVSSRVSRDEYAALKAEQVINEDYGGSLPGFLAAFAERREISSSEIDEIQMMIDEYRKGE